MENRTAPRSYEREPGTGTPVSEIANLTFSAPHSMRDEIPKRIQANYAASPRRRRRSRRVPRWKFWAR